jgi:predicted nucleic acid-binding OB-fold protein
MLRANSIVVVVVVVMMVVSVAMRHHDNHGPAPMAVMMVVMELRQLNVVRRQRRFAFIDRLQLRLGVRDRLQQIGERIRL